VRLKESTRNNADFECVEAVRYLWGYSNGMVAHAHALDAGEIAAPHTVPSHASANHPM
jgi:glutamyl-tRNA reductase